MSRRGQLGQVRTATPASGYIGFYPGFQPASDTTVLDRSGKGAHALLNALTPAEAWAAAPNGVSSLDATNKFALVPASAFIAWQPGMSLIIAMDATLTKKASNSAFAGNGAGGGASGIALRCTSTGQLQFTVYDAAGALVGAPGATTETPWAAAVPARVLVAVDGPAQKLLMWVNGARAANYGSAQLLSAYLAAAFVSPTAGFGLGGRTAADRTAGVFRGCHLYAAAGPIFEPAIDLYSGRLDELAAFHHRAPAQVWTPSMMVL